MFVALALVDSWPDAVVLVVALILIAAIALKYIDYLDEDE
jgi:hypothetical protein